MQKYGLKARPRFAAGVALLGIAGVLALGTVRLSAQESLGERARRIRAQKEIGAQGEAASGEKKMSPAAADFDPITQKPRVMGAPDLTATVGLIQETDPEKYQEGVRQMLEQERFRVLDDVAAGERMNKARFPGGGWKLWWFYNAIASPAGKGRGVVADWNAYRERLNSWVGQMPESVTARVALAQAELLYGWELRGPGELGTIAQDKFDRFMAAVKQAETILNGASELQAKDPEWYDVMLQVGRAKVWELQDLNTLLERAAAFEPGYFYVYQQMALTLTPKWRGRDGDAEKFAEEVGDRVGGKPGAILYWQIAESIMENPELAKLPQRFVWSRALIGYQALVEQYGVSTVRQNQIAFMAARFGDYMTADDVFLQLGDRWDAGTWGTQEYFEKVRAWARGTAGPFKKIIQAYKAVNENVATPEGARYDGQIAKEFGARYARSVEDCRSAQNAPTLLILQVGKNGGVQQLLVVPETATDACVRPKLEKANFSPPPRPEYWVRVSLK